MLLVLAASHAHGLSVHAVYRTACNREVGVILKVEKREILLLRLDGELVKIPRHEIVSLLYYSLSQLPLSRVPTHDNLPPLRVQTVHDGQIVDLVTGWPIDYSERQVSFLLRNGKELVVERDSIWSLTYVHENQAEPSPPAGSAIDIELVHAQTSGFCTEGGAPATEKRRQVFAQQILNDQIVIRRELDRLAEGYLQILEYEQDQKFYPVPLLYRNRTLLGLWVSAGSRYGASQSRTNNYSPILVDELALGPFRYQHLFLSGSAPNDLFLHHEAQTQIYYRFKAAYFHTSVFFDPSLLLVGTKYPWSESDLADESLDDRLNEVVAIELGFDWGPLAIELAPAVLAQSAVKVGASFDENLTHNLWRVGARMTFRRWQAELLAGLATTEEREFDRGADWRYRYVRANVGWETCRKLELKLSGIVRTLAYEMTEAQGFGEQEIVLEYDSLNVSASLQAMYPIGRRISVGGLGIVELQDSEGGGAQRTRVMARMGVFSGFWF